MARLVLCLTLAVFVGCRANGDDGARLLGRVQALTASLDDARSHSSRVERRLEGEHRRRLALERKLERSDDFDLGSGGPTIGGPLLALPRLGTFRWGCDDARRFDVVFSTAGASVHARYETQGETRREMLHSDDEMTAVVAAGETVSWTITYRHLPGFVRARVQVSTEASKHGLCLLPSVRVEQTGRHYD